MPGRDYVTSTVTASQGRPASGWAADGVRANTVASVVTPSIGPVASAPTESQSRPDSTWVAPIHSGEEFE